MLLAECCGKHDMRAIQACVIFGFINKSIPQWRHCINASVSIFDREKKRPQMTLIVETVHSLSWFTHLLYRVRILLCSKGRRHSQVTVVNKVVFERRNSLQDFTGNSKFYGEYRLLCWQASQSTEQIRKSQPSNFNCSYLIPERSTWHFLP